MSGTLIPIGGTEICNNFVFSKLRTLDGVPFGVRFAFTTPSRRRKTGVMKAYGLRRSPELCVKKRKGNQERTSEGNAHRKRKNENQTDTPSTVRRGVCSP